MRTIYFKRIGQKISDLQYYSLCDLIINNDHSVRQIKENLDLEYKVFEISKDDLTFYALFCLNSRRITSFWKEEDEVDIYSELMSYIDSLYFAFEDKQDLASKKKIGKMTALRNKLFKESPICGICGGKIKQVGNANIDHIIPKAKGGTNAKSNLQLAHIQCNHKKGDKV